MAWRMATKKLIVTIIEFYCKFIHKQVSHIGVRFEQNKNSGPRNLQ